MSYTVNDFSESLSRSYIEPNKVAQVVAAWGWGNGQGAKDQKDKKFDDGYGVSDWAGGFLLKMVRGDHIYLSGWCDYTGWGCQDGIEIEYLGYNKPDFKHLGGSDRSAETDRPIPKEEWDLEPIDLNNWLQGNRKD